MKTCPKKCNLVSPPVASTAFQQLTGLPGEGLHPPPPYATHADIGFALILWGQGPKLPAGSWRTGLQGIF